MLRTRSVRPPTLWLQILLVGGLACVVLLAVQAYQSQRSSRAMAERALRDYAHFAAWSYREHLAVRLREVTDELLGAVNHGDGLHESPTIPDVSELGHYLDYDERCACHRARRGPLPVRFLGFTLGSDTLGVAVNRAPSSVGGWRADSDVGGDRVVRPMLSAELLPLNRMIGELGRQSQEAWGYAVRVVTLEGQTHLLGVRSMPTQWGDTVVYGFDHDAAALGTILSGLLASGDLLPSTVVAGRTNAEVFDIEVSDPSGVPVFRSGARTTWDLGATAELPASFGGFRIRAQLRPEMGEAILIGGVPGSRVPVMLVMMVLALGLTILAAVQLRREVRFAAERASFVANVSHELRTPLAQVRLVLDTMRLGRMGDVEARDRSLSVADREVLRLQHLVDGLLRFTRGPRRNGAAIAVDAAQEARAVVAEFEPLALQHEVRVELHTEDSVPARLSNGALRQVLLNLLDNAVKYGGVGGTIRIEVRRRADGGVHLTVDDSGPGVPPEERKRIWRSFERGDVARDRGVGGSGIGLTIVRELAEENGGSATVESAPGGGARFVVDLPDAAA